MLLVEWSLFLNPFLTFMPHLDKLANCLIQMTNVIFYALSGKWVVFNTSFWHSSGNFCCIFTMIQAWICTRSTMLVQSQSMLPSNCYWEQTGKKPRPVFTQTSSLFRIATKKLTISKAPWSMIFLANRCDVVEVFYPQNAHTMNHIALITSPIEVRVW